MFCVCWDADYKGEIPDISGSAFNSGWFPNKIEYQLLIMEMLERNIYVCMHHMFVHCIRPLLKFHMHSTAICMQCIMKMTCNIIFLSKGIINSTEFIILLIKKTLNSPLLCLFGGGGSGQPPRGPLWILPYSYYICLSRASGRWLIKVDVIWIAPSRWYLDLAGWIAPSSWRLKPPC